MKYPSPLLLKIRLLPTSKNNLEEIINYLFQYSEKVALNHYDKIIDKISMYKSFPGNGKKTGLVSQIKI